MDNKIINNKRIVVALGRNAFGSTFPEQQANVKKAASAIADLVEAKYKIVICTIKIQKI